MSDIQSWIDEIDKGFLELDGYIEILHNIDEEDVIIEVLTLSMRSVLKTQNKYRF